MVKMIFKYMTRDTRLIGRFILAMGILWVFVLQLKTYDLQEAKMQKIQRQYSELAQAARAERTPTVLQQIVARPEAKPDIELILEGMVKDGNQFHALINGNVYNKGDRISNYVVDDISMNQTSLRNTRTNETVTLALPSEIF